MSKKEITYRLHLTDSNNHAVFVDLNKLEDIKDSKVGAILLNEYEELIAEHSEAQKKAVKNDKEVAKRVEKNKNKLNVKTEPTIEGVDGEEAVDEEELTDEEIADLEE